MPNIKQINVVFIYVKDLGTMKEFYGNTIGLGKPKVESDLWVEYELSGSNFALHQGDPLVLDGIDPSENSVKFCFEVDDIEAAAAELKGKGVKFTVEPRNDFKSLIAEFKDPERNLIRIVQYR